MGVFVIAEAGVNHNGDETLAVKLVETAAACGADAVKFQTFSADNLVTPGAEKAEYQKQATGNGDQYSMLKALEMSPLLHQKLVERCSVLGIEFMSTPFDEEATDFLLGLGMRRIKIPSGEITNLPFLTFLAGKGLPLVLSTGMASLDEIQVAIAIIADERTRQGYDEPLAQVLTILHCTSNYPAQCDDVNLRAMQTIADATGLPVGYSDHTLGIAVSTAAVALGAVVIEKHFTLDKNMSGPDHKASLTPDELTQLVRQIRDVEAALGSTIKQPTDSELPVRKLVRRSVTSTRCIGAGSVIQREDLALLRPGTGIAPVYLDAVVGRVAVRDIAPGTTLQWENLM
ncbi:N-acetylneuraminate synthase [Herbaspirillum sp. SJZ099]|uniref:N-acetylneuraminate synthase n=1 Tax=Herbaspirillum sp. SJZ099 TaxID=2572916 RepID=UPI0011A8CF8B|nr:N-acetylneuraminate synthase [Herbaspirillum sp. SJZ099]TWC68391.1 N-acetylneuraminate synthase [Herbaspirillum sp. SJZ099]